MSHDHHHTQPSLASSLSYTLFGKPSKKGPDQDRTNALTTTLALLMASYFIPGANSRPAAGIKKYNGPGSVQSVSDIDDFGFCRANLSLNITQTDKQYDLAQHFPTLGENAFPEMKACDYDNQKASESAGGSELYDHNKYICYQLHYDDPETQKISDYQLTFIRPETFTDKTSAYFMYKLLRHTLKVCSIYCAKNDKGLLTKGINHDGYQVHRCDPNNGGVEIINYNMWQYNYFSEPYSVSSFDLRKPAFNHNPKVERCLGDILQTLNRNFQSLQFNSELNKKNNLLYAIITINVMAAVVNTGIIARRIFNSYDDDEPEERPTLELE